MGPNLVLHSPPNVLSEPAGAPKGH